jgi:CheY-like chemotaxis protein
MNTILLIDDDDAVLASTSRLLKHLGYVVEQASNGMEGIELFQSSGEFAMVITDLRMPFVNGNDVAREIRRSDKPKTPIVAVTGSEYVEEIRRELFDSVLIKPFKLEALVDVMKTFM